MKESYEKGLANRSASNLTLAVVTSRVWHGQEVHAGPVFSSPVIPETLPPLSRAHTVLTVEGFFDAIDHSWLIKFLEPTNAARRCPIGDRRILRLIRKWLHAGVIEEGQWSETTAGSPPTHEACVPVGDFTVTFERVPALRV